jgi:endonuclease III
LKTLSGSDVGAPHHDVLLLEHPDEVRITQHIPLELLVVLMLSAHQDDHADLPFFPHIDEKFPVWTDVEFRERADRGGT